MEEGPNHLSFQQILALNIYSNISKLFSVNNEQVDISFSDTKDLEIYENKLVGVRLNLSKIKFISCSEDEECRLQFEIQFINNGFSLEDYKVAVTKLVSEFENHIFPSYDNDKYELKFDIQDQLLSLFTCENSDDYTRTFSNNNITNSLFIDLVLYERQ